MYMSSPSFLDYIGAKGTFEATCPADEYSKIIIAVSAVHEIEAIIFRKSETMKAEPETRIDLCEPLLSVPFLDDSQYIHQLSGRHRRDPNFGSSYSRNYFSELASSSNMSISAVSARASSHKTLLQKHHSCKQSATLEQMSRESKFVKQRL